MLGDFDSLLPLKAISFFCIHTGAVLHQLKGDTLCMSLLVNWSSVSQLTALSAARWPVHCHRPARCARVVWLAVAVSSNSHYNTFLCGKFHNIAWKLKDFWVVFFSFIAVGLQGPKDYRLKKLQRFNHFILSMQPHSYLFFSNIQAASQDHNLVFTVTRHMKSSFCKTDWSFVSV